MIKWPHVVCVRFWKLTPDGCCLKSAGGFFRADGAVHRKLSERLSRKLSNGLGNWSLLARGRRRPGRYDSVSFRTYLKRQAATPSGCYVA